MQKGEGAGTVKACGGRLSCCFRAGEKMAGIQDVARLAGVGTGTVSRVINGSGYVSSKTLRDGWNRFALHESGAHAEEEDPGGAQTGGL